MTRRECEKKLTDLMEQAYALFKQFNPDGNHLSMFATDDGNQVLGYLRKDGQSITIIDGFKAPNGCYRLSGE